MIRDVSREVAIHFSMLLYVFSYRVSRLFLATNHRLINSRSPRWIERMERKAGLA